VGISAAVAWGLRELLADLVPGTGTWHAVLDLAVVGAAYLAIYVGLARLLRISEVNDVMALITRRLRGRR
jgi:putative peptidoglycan lipid II flippase